MKKITLFIIFIALGLLVYWKWDILTPYFRTDSLNITLNTPANDLSPYALDLNNGTRVSNVYEGLIALDRNLNVIPALAISWGNLNDLTWEFRLREGVSFQDGSLFVAQDVLDTFERAKQSDNPQIKPYIQNIRELAINDKGRIELTTFTPDPLLLSKLSKLYIVKENKVGTGPYKITKENLETGAIDLEVFPGYWGPTPDYKKVSYLVEPNWTEREADFKRGKISILGAVTPDLALTIPKEQIKTGYGLEVNFLMFKLDDPLFKDKKNRETIQRLIDPQMLASIGNNFVKPATQFLASGVFGYNQNLKGFAYDPQNEPRDLFGVQLEKLELDYLSSFRTLAEYLSSQLKKAGFSVKLKANEAETMLQKIEQNNSRLYLLGWQAEDGDAGGFYEAFIHTQGIFNKGRYNNPELNKMIESARQDMNPQSRLKTLKEIATILQNDVIGIPLFETSRLYAVRKYIDWEPRLDGLILAKEVKK